MIERKSLEVANQTSPSPPRYIMLPAASALSYSGHRGRMFPISLIGGSIPVLNVRLRALGPPKNMGISERSSNPRQLRFFLTFSIAPVKTHLGQTATKQTDCISWWLLLHKTSAGTEHDTFHDDLRFPSSSLSSHGYTNMEWGNTRARTLKTFPVLWQGADASRALGW